MLTAEFTELFSIEVASATCGDLADPELADACSATGGEQHSYALIPLALLTGLMAAGAALAGSRPAGYALVAVGLLVLGITLIGDLPDTGRTGEVGASFTSAEAVRGPALWLELAGGALALVAGALSLLPRPGGQRSA
jgi:4-hydroxybenzoate polyprenyltransferase